MKLFSQNEKLDIKRIAKKEYNILKKVQDHPNIIKVYDFAIRNGHIEVPNCIPRDEDDKFSSQRTGVKIYKDATYITMELLNNGDFFDVIKSTEGLKNL